MFKISTFLLVHVTRLGHGGRRECGEEQRGRGLVWHSWSSPLQSVRWLFLLQPTASVINTQGSHVTKELFTFIHTTHTHTHKVHKGLVWVQRLDLSVNLQLVVAQHELFGNKTSFFVFKLNLPWLIEKVNWQKVKRLHVKGLKKNSNPAEQSKKLCWHHLKDARRNVWQWRSNIWKLMFWDELINCAMCNRCVTSRVQSTER